MKILLSIFLLVSINAFAGNDFLYVYSGGGSNLNIVVSTAQGGSHSGNISGSGGSTPYPGTLFYQVNNNQQYYGNLSKGFHIQGTYSKGGTNNIVISWDSGQRWGSIYNPSTAPYNFDQGDVTYYYQVDAGETGPPPCNTNIVATVKNNDTKENIYFFERADGQIYASTTATVAPGAAATFTVTVPCADAQQGVGLWKLGEGLVPSSPAITNVSYGAPTGNTNGSVLQNSTNSATSSTPSAPANYDPSKQGSGVLYTAPANTNAIISQQQGDSALYDAVVKFAAQNHNDEKAIQGAVSTNQANRDLLQSMTNLLTGIKNNLTNSISNGTGTNSLSLTNYATESTLRSIGSNTAVANIWLAGIYSNTLNRTNEFSTNDLSGSYSNDLLNAFANGTNAAIATSHAEGIFSDTLGWLSGISSGLSVETALSDYGSGSSAMTVSFAGYTMNFDPAVNMPVVGTFAQGIIKFVIACLYLYMVGQLYAKTVRTMASTQMAGVPNIQMELFGTGGNLIGVLLAVVVPAVFLFLWVSVFTYFATDVIGVLGIIQGISVLIDAVAGTPAGAVGIHLFFFIFPVGFFIHCVGAYLMLMLTMQRASLIAVAASRFLFGK